MKELIESSFRESDFFIRWGGEEFLIVTRFIDRTEIELMVERFRQAVAKHDFTLTENQSIQCTCSIGFAAYPFSPEQPKLLNWEQVIDVADTALYAAKEKQRNAWVGLMAASNLTTNSERGLNGKNDYIVANQSFLEAIKDNTNQLLNDNTLSCVSSIKATDIKELFN